MPPTTAEATHSQTQSDLSLSETARRAARAHAVDGIMRHSQSLLALRETYARYLRRAHRTVAAEEREALLPGRAAEWLLDNFYVVQQALREIKEDLPARYFAELPRLTHDDEAGRPRVYAVARTFLQYARGHIDVSDLVEFAETYQQERPLTMGELWALPTMLRLGLLQMLVHSLARLTDEPAPGPPPPVAAGGTLSTDEVVARAILGLRAVNNADWRAFFEQTSLVERTLAADPAGVYVAMDFDSRDRYRKRVEQLAQAASATETHVAETAVSLAAQSPDASARRRHVGYFLVDAGRARHEAALHYRPGPARRLRRWLIDAHPTATYLGSIGLATAVLLLIVLAYTASQQGSLLQLAFAALLAFIPAVTVAVSLVNALVTRLVPPRVLPKLDYEDGIPADCQTMVIMPILLSSPQDVGALTRQLQLHYLRNPDPQLSFALLADFADAPEAHMPEDASLLDAAREAIDALNTRYAAGHGRAPFYFLHRERLWNPGEGVWMGWERKRGKLEEFNRLVLGEDDTSFTTIVGDCEHLSQIRFVITLDADTTLPRGAAQRLIGTLAHPLNQPRFDPQTGRLRAGYTILQPRTEVQPTSANRTFFARVFSGDSHFDLYTRAMSDVYQDLFGEGIYVGKGIYDLRAFQRTLSGRVPENALLSHDLFEGVNGRVGLVTDIILYEDYPPDYLAEAHRRHRWIRGDWQLLPWLLPFNTYPEQKRSRLSAIDRWKLLDNLRRSLLGPALLAWLLAGWLWLPGSPWVWTLLALLVPGYVALSGAVSNLIGNLRSANPRPVGDVVGMRQLLRWLFALVFLLYEALVALDAIAAVLVRLYVTRKHLLQWTTAAHSVRIFGKQRKVQIAWREMYVTPLVAIALGVLVAFFNLTAFWVVAPLLLAWAISPQVAVWISRSLVREVEPLSPAQRQTLRALARSTWLYFEQYVGPVDHWLAPDHFQENPRGTVAHRTSPTNLGLALLTTLAAFDFGYVGLWEMSLRLSNTLDSLDRLEKYRGHFLNWYDTRTLEPLPPRYVSTVDSGNLAACLMALRQGCLDAPRVTMPRKRRWRGLLDTANVLETVLSSVETRAPAAVEPLCERLDAIQAKVRESLSNQASWLPLLVEITKEDWPELERGIVRLTDAGRLKAEDIHRIRLYADRLRHHLFDARRRMQDLVPWWLMLPEVPQWVREAAPDSAVGQAWAVLRDALPRQLTVGDMRPTCARARALLTQLEEAVMAVSPTDLHPDVRTAALTWCADLKAQLQQAAERATTLLNRYAALSRRLDALVGEMEFGFLYDERRKVFRIGYNVDAEKPDDNYYDLLASEARLASLVAIGKGDVPERHWLHLGRPFIQLDSRRALLSWSGTMFEYLMPILLTRQYPDTLLDTALRTAVDRQIEYTAGRNIPWGISESGYYRFDALLNYQYRAFGVPGLGLKRGLDEDLVIAPYASLLALPLRPQAVMDNLTQLRELGMWGDYGLYEAVDFTPSRLGLGQPQAIIRSFMVHHQGMIMLALANALTDDIMVRRFHADPRIQSVELLLQEDVPQRVPLTQPADEQAPPLHMAEVDVATTPWSVPVRSAFPQVHHLSNGRYRLLITNSGAGYSSLGPVDLTRWRADTTRDDWGSWLYIQDLDSGALTSAAPQPAGGGSGWDVSFSPHKVDFQGRHDDLLTHLAITVPPEDDLEIRRLQLINQSSRPRHLRLCTYAEPVLADQNSDRRHPAFNKLFIQCEPLADGNGLLFTRRPRSADETPPCIIHKLVAPPGEVPTVSLETDRHRFLGREGTPQAPAIFAFAHDGFQREVEPVLDPIMALSLTIEIPPHSSRELTFLTLAADSREAALSLAQRYHSWDVVTHAFDAARAHHETQMRQLELTAEQLADFQKLLSLLIYPHAALRADPAVLVANQKGQPGLWAFGISGDYPILLVRVADERQLGLVRELLRAHTVWRRQGLKIDLVILNARERGYEQVLQGQIRRLLARTNSEDWLNRRGGIFIVAGDALAEAELVLLETAARVVLDAEQGDLTQYIGAIPGLPWRLPDLIPARGVPELPEIAPVPRPADLQFDNGLGGFTGDGREYVIYLEPGAPTPAPWSNVIANEQFGFLVTERGSGYSWAVNSGENRLTPWSNDPVRDAPGEALYLRDEEDGRIWSPTPLPAGEDTPYLVRHGAGYTTFEHHSHGLEQRLQLFADPEQPVKIIQLRLTNRWERPRRLTATYFAEWVLGVNRDQAQQFVVPEYAESHHALLAHSAYNTEFEARVAFLAASQTPHGLTADRTEFLGRMGDLRQPAALRRVGLSGTVQAGVDPCAALQLHVELQPNESKTIYFLLGQGSDRDAALSIIDAFRSPERVACAWRTSAQRWDDLLGRVQVETPDAAMNLVLNRWLLYQDLSCRIWGRSAFYQSSGAYGFRDQLQDVLAVLHAAPELARGQILRAARHQFEAGDVLHWWHPPSGRGVRTRITDDLLWLPYVTAVYVQTTGDASILQAQVPFRQGEPLAPDEEERYGHYRLSAEPYSLYDHCVRAIERGSTAGRHGLPLMGAGDWNDGMNRVGIHGKGESVWLGWFLHAALDGMLALCALRGDDERAERYRARQAELRVALEKHGWDGRWYRRAYYDDGTPLGSQANRECRIDSIAQSWAAISGAGRPEHVAQALDAVEKHLVRPSDQLILLFTPPFDKTPRDPGYIKGYPPGIRENGGQYTHAAIWAVWAFTSQGDGARAAQLFHLLNPVYHADDARKVRRYRVEPYVVAADVYGERPFVGRGGWTWYTGSGGWLYRLGVEAILGLQRRGDKLALDPCIPPDWPSYKLTVQCEGSVYHIRVENPDGCSRGVAEVRVDGEVVADGKIKLGENGRSHNVTVRLGAAS